MAARGRRRERNVNNSASEAGWSVWRLMLGVSLVLFAIALTLAIYVNQTLSTPLSPGDKLYTIKRGESLQGFLKSLKREGLIDEVYSMRIYALLKGWSGRIKAGQYLFEDGISQIGILEKIVAGDVVRYRVQFIEGWTFREFREALYQHEELDHVTMGSTDMEIMEALGRPGEHPEGRFFPDTYTFIAGDSDLDILARAHEIMEQVLEDAWRTRDEDLPIETSYEALILASIVEKETGLAQERETIAGVFVNRLRRNMRLQTDPTVIYGLADEFDGNITRRHLTEDNPYNTYTRAGLPPTPIAMPGREAIHAAVHPGDTNYLYFVSRGDGSHYFSASLEEHNEAVRKYQLRRNSDG
jgi:UPF0755 protein